MKFHELFQELALESQRFNADIPPAALPLVEYGLARIRAAETFEEFLDALRAVPPPPVKPAEPN